MIRKVLIAAGIAAVVTVGGSLIHPLRMPGAPGNGHTILREAQIDPDTLAILQRACQNCHSQTRSGPGTVVSRRSPGCSPATFSKRVFT